VNDKARCVSSTRPGKNQWPPWCTLTRKNSRPGRNFPALRRERSPQDRRDRGQVRHDVRRRTRWRTRDGKPRRAAAGRTTWPISTRLTLLRLSDVVDDAWVGLLASPATDRYKPNPIHVARKIASADHISDGRCAGGMSSKHHRKSPKAFQFRTRSGTMSTMPATGTGRSKVCRSCETALSF